MCVLAPVAMRTDPSAWEGKGEVNTGQATGQIRNLSPVSQENRSQNILLLHFFPQENQKVENLTTKCTIH